MSSKRVIFVKRPAVGFSESSWTLVSELTTQPARKVANPNPPNRFTSLLQEKARKCTHRPSSTITERMGIAARVPRQPNLECLPRRTGIHDWMANWEYLPRFPFRTETSVFTCYKFSSSLFLTFRHHLKKIDPLVPSLYTKTARWQPKNSAQSDQSNLKQHLMNRFHGAETISYPIGNENFASRRRKRGGAVGAPYRCHSSMASVTTLSVLSLSTWRNNIWKIIQLN